MGPLFVEGGRASVPLAACATLGKSLTPVRTPIGEAWILGQDEPLFRAAPGPAAPARLLPSGDTLFLLQGADRELLVQGARQHRTRGRPGSGRAPCSSTVRPPAPGGARSMC